MKLREVEVALGVSRITLLRWLKSGKIVGVKVGFQWRVTESAVEDAKKSAHV